MEQYAEKILLGPLCEFMNVHLSWKWFPSLFRPFSMEIKISLHQEAVRMNKIPFFRLNRELWDIVDDGKNS